MALIDKLTKIGEAVRERANLDEPLTLDRMAIEIKNIPYPITDTLIVRENGTYLAPEGFDGYELVDVDIQPTLEKLTVEANGIYTPSVGVDGYNEVEVGIYPKTETIKITSNGVYTPSDGVDGFSSVEVETVSLPAEALTITGDCNNLFANAYWEWFIKTYGDKITTKDLSNVNNMFSGVLGLEEIPIDLNILLSPYGSSIQTIADDTFKLSQSTSILKKFPNFYLKTPLDAGEKPIVIGCWANETPNIFWDENVKIVGFIYDSLANNRLMVQEPTWLFNQIDWEYGRTANVFGTTYPVSLSNCYNLKYFPSYKHFWTNMTGTYYHTWYQGTINHCHNLREIVLPRPGASVLTSSPSGFGFQNLYSLKNIEFDVQDNGEPYVGQWKNVTINLTNIVGYGPLSYLFEGENIVTDQAATYELYKDQEYRTTHINYSRYNLASAIRTIHSLPDCSATGTNTIKFKGASGALTDAGAINTMSAEDIAVATAKGWTVTFA